MDVNKMRKNLGNLLQKYKYVLLISMIGLTFMLLPSGNSAKDDKSTEPCEVQNSSVQAELENILSCMQGAGEVKVLLTEQEGEEMIYQKDEDSSSSETANSLQTKVVTVTDSERNEKGLVQKIIPPRYRGAIILCQGADDPALKLAITNAVSKITGLGTDKIAVLKMK